MKEITRVRHDAEQFEHDDRLYEITTLTKRKNVWTIHKRFGGKARYRVLSDTKSQTPVGVQRLKAS